MIILITLLFIIWRVSLFIVAYVGSKFIAFTPSFPYSDALLIPSGLPAWIWSFANFDGVHYLTIAKTGYSAQFTQVFFPLYPMLIGFVSKIITFINPIVIGLFISNIFFLLSMIILYKLLNLDYKDSAVKWTMLIIFTFPTSFFFGSLYSESLFLFLVLTSFYAARRRKWWLAGILGGLASATRLVGIFLLPALIWERYEENIKYLGQRPISLWLKKSKINKFLHSPFSILHSPIFYLVPLGLIVYMLYLQMSFGDFLYFWHVQPIFGAERSGTSLILPPQVVWRYLKIFFTVPTSNYNFWVAAWELASVVVACCLLIVGVIKKLRISYLIFASLVIIIPTLTGTFSSMPRYILAAFPIFIVLGLIRSRLLKILFLVSCFLFLVIFTLLFTSGRWVS